MYNLLLSLLAPPFCGNCHRYLSRPLPLCEDCFKQVVAPVSVTVGSLKVHALSGYTYPMKSLFYQSYERAEQLGSLLAERISGLSVDIVVPVPEYSSDIRKKGYDNSVVIAQQISKQTGLPVVACLERRLPMGKHQSRVEHLQTVKGAFRALPEVLQVTGKRVLLIDQVAKTGATLVAAADEVRLGAPQDIQALVGCRVIS